MKWIKKIVVFGLSRLYCLAPQATGLRFRLPGTAPDYLLQPIPRKLRQHICRLNLRLLWAIASGDGQVSLLLDCWSHRISM